jgi:hypothetical protein
MKPTSANSAAMHPALIITCALWLGAALQLALFAYLLATSGWATFPALIFLPLAAGFLIHMAIRSTQRYRRGLPLHQQE